MSLSSITSSTISAFPAARASHASARRDTVAAPETAGGPQAGPRQLRSALTDTLAATAGGSADLTSDAARDALGDFSAELFDALRAEGGREVGHGPGRHLQRGHAWGHYRGGALAERIEALAAKLGAGSTAPAEPASTDVAPVEAVTDGAVPAPAEPTAVEAAPVVAESPVQPVPASSLETSFAALWQALNPEAGAGADLASFLNALVARLRGSDEPAPVGSLIDTTA